MNRVVMWSVLVGLATMYMPVSAMEFGQVKVRSALAQPLLAEVPLHSARAGELDRLQVSLATAAEFSRAGLDPAAASLPLQFSLRDAGGGHRLLQISSSRAFNVAYLDVLLALSGRQGRSLQELAIVLNPDAGHTLAAGSNVAAKPLPATAPGAIASAADGRPQHTLVQSGQTLSAIAREHLVPGISLDQMLLAYQQANPQAFYAGNISALKAGAILRAPTRSEAAAVSRAAAYQAVIQQNQAWRAGRPIRPSVLANAAAAAPAPAKAPAHADGDRLALLAGRGQPRAGQRDSLAQEALHTSQQQAADLASRVHDLQVMQQERDRLIALKFQQIAQLQQQLRAAQAKAPVAASTPGGATAAAGRLAATDPRLLWGGLAGVVGIIAALLVAARARRRMGATPVATLPAPPEAGPTDSAVASLPPVLDTERELARLNGLLQHDPDNLDLYFELASLYFARHDVAHFVATAESMHSRLSHPDDPDWVEVKAMGQELLPAHPLFAAAPLPAVVAPVAAAEPYSVTWVQPSATAATDAAPAKSLDAPSTPAVESLPAMAVTASEPAASTPTPTSTSEPAEPVTAAVESVPAAAQGFTPSDPIDTKLDLARAYLDMQQPASARAMLEEVLAEGSQMQKDVAQQLLNGLAPG